MTFWLLAEVAFRLSIRAARRAEVRLADAKRLNARADFWADVQAWTDGLGTWSDLRRRRQQVEGSRGLVRR